MSKLKLKKILKEHTLSLAGGVISKPAFHTDMSLSNMVKEKYGEVESETKISSEQILSKIQEFGQLGKSIYKSGDLKETAKTLSDIANAAKVHTLRETEDWFDKVTVNRNMKELTNLSKHFGKLSEEASSVQQRLEALYEDMGIVDDELTEEDTKYAKFFKGALKKFGVSTPAELGDKKKDFFNYVDKNYAADNETD
jgi:DNA-binding transcriptional ArsR family regulator